MYFTFDLLSMKFLIIYKEKKKKKKRSWPSKSEYLKGVGEEEGRKNL
jgi:hypothetical protein